MAWPILTNVSVELYINMYINHDETLMNFKLTIIITKLTFILRIPGGRNFSPEGLR